MYRLRGPFPRHLHALAIGVLFAGFRKLRFLLGELLDDVLDFSRGGVGLFIGFGTYERSGGEEKNKAERALQQHSFYCDGLRWEGVTGVATLKEMAILSIPFWASFVRTNQIELCKSAALGPHELVLHFDDAVDPRGLQDTVGTTSAQGVVIPPNSRFVHAH